MPFLLVAAFLTAAYWFVGGMVLYTDGLAHVTGVGRWGVGGGNLSHAMVALGAAVAITTVVLLRKRKPPRKRAILGYTAGLTLALFIAATPWLLEFMGAAMTARQVRVRYHAADRLASARDLAHARTITALPYLRGLLDNGDPQVTFEAAYGLALLGRRNARVHEAFVEFGDIVFEAEESLQVPVDSILICELFAVVRDEWPSKTALPKNTWASVEEFRREWLPARARLGATQRLLSDKLESIAGEPDPRVPALIDALSGEDADDAESELKDFLPGKVAGPVAAALRTLPPPEKRLRLERVARSIWGRRGE
jgi:hypothetical protein